jgi:hypothetical protein
MTHSAHNNIQSLDLGDWPSKESGAVRVPYFSNIVLRSSKALEQHSEQQRHVRDHREPELVFGEKLDA